MLAVVSTHYKNKRRSVSLLVSENKEIIYLTTHTTHFIYGYMASDIMVKDHSDRERGNPLPPLKGFFYMHHLTYRLAHTKAFVTPVMEHWLEREIAEWVHHERMLLPLSEKRYLI